MNDQQLDRNLRSIGKTCFVKYFEKFCDSNLSNSDVASLIKAEGYTWKSCLSRTSHARAIINSPRCRDALLAVCESMRLERTIRDKAALLFVDPNRKRT